MVPRRLAVYILFCITLWLAPVLRMGAQNPVVQTKFTADPAPLVYGDRVYLFTSHDEDDAEGFHMLDWRLYSSSDMANWTDHGAVASLATFPWAVQTNDAWAPQAVERNGKFYLYVPISVAGKPKNVIAVAVADNPAGPYKDALGHPLIAPADGYIDPTVWIDTDGQASLYWGNPHLWYVKLNNDMVSYSGEIQQVDSLPANYQEGPWVYKRQGHFYLAYASHCCPEGIGYAMASSPTGPWTYRGMIMDPTARSSGNHPGIVDFKGKSYLFGFDYTLNFALTDSHRERRSVNVATLTYNADGTIQTLPGWDKQGVPQVGTLNPFQRVEGETIAYESGVRTTQSRAVGVYVTNITDGSYIKVRGVDFGRGASRFTAGVASDSGGSVIDLHLDGVAGPLIGTLPVSSTGGLDTWQSKATPVVGARGVHDLFLVFKRKNVDSDANTNLFNLDYWRFTK